MCQQALVSHTHTLSSGDSAFVQGEMDVSGCARGSINLLKKKSVYIWYSLGLYWIKTLFTCLNKAHPLFFHLCSGSLSHTTFPGASSSLVLFSDVSISDTCGFTLKLFLRWFLRSSYLSSVSHCLDISCERMYRDLSKSNTYHTLLTHLSICPMKDRLAS